MLQSMGLQRVGHNWVTEQWWWRVSPSQYKRVWRRLLNVCETCVINAYLESCLLWVSQSHSLGWVWALWDTSPNTFLGVWLGIYLRIILIQLSRCLSFVFFPPLFQSLSLFRTALHFLLKLIADFFGSPRQLSFIQEEWSPFSANSLHIAAYLSFYWRQNKTSKTPKKLEHPFSPFQLTPTSVYLGSNLRFIWWNM